MLGPLVLLGRVIDLDDLILEANFLQARHNPRGVGEYRRSEHLHRRHLSLLSSAFARGSDRGEVNALLCLVRGGGDQGYATQNELSLANYLPRTVVWPIIIRRWSEGPCIHIHSSDGLDCELNELYKIRHVVRGPWRSPARSSTLSIIK